LPPLLRICPSFGVNSVSSVIAETPFAGQKSQETGQSCG
jgi:hypothetical protein